MFKRLTHNLTDYSSAGTPKGRSISSFRPTSDIVSTLFSRNLLLFLVGFTLHICQRTYKPVLYDLHLFLAMFHNIYKQCSNLKTNWTNQKQCSKVISGVDQNEPVSFHVGWQQLYTILWLYYIRLLRLLQSVWDRGEHAQLLRFQSHLRRLAGSGLSTSELAEPACAEGITWTSPW